MPVEFSTTGFCPALQGAAIARESEALGFDVQMFGENHAMAPDVFGEMRAAAAVTSSIRLLCGPVNFVTRDPGVIASAIAPVQVLSGGRAVCGIARGDSAVAMAGRAPQRQAELVRDLERLRTYLARGTVKLPERESRLEWLGELEYERVPIELVCSGPRTIALAARVADRVGLSVGGHPERIRWAIRIIEQALAEAGRSREELTVVAFVPLAVGDDRASARAALKSRVSGWAHMSSFRGIDLEQQPPILRRVTRALRDSYDYGHHRSATGGENPNDRAIDEEFADWFGIGGPPSYLLDRLGALVELGVDGFGIVLGPGERERFARDVMPPLRKVKH